MKTMHLKIASILMLSILLFSCKKEEPEEVSEEETTIEPPTFVLSAASSIAENTVFLSGTVDGEKIVEAGFVYGSSQELNENSIKKSFAYTEKELSATLTGLTQDKTYYYAIYATTEDDVFHMSSVSSFKTLKEVVYEIGDYFEGGIIYELNSDKKSGMLVSPSDVTEAKNWQTAKDECDAYVLEGNDSWRMPTISELELLYTQSSKIGGFANIAYWSRTDHTSDDKYAYGVFFGSGIHAGKTFDYLKTNGYQHSRAVRSFYE